MISRSEAEELQRLWGVVRERLGQEWLGDEVIAGVLESGRAIVEANGWRIFLRDDRLLAGRLEGTEMVGFEIDAEGSWHERHRHKAPEMARAARASMN